MLLKNKSKLIQNKYLKKSDIKNVAYNNIIRTEMNYIENNSILTKFIIKKSIMTN